MHFLAGRDAYEQGQWLKAVDRFRTIYNARANYLDSTVVSMLYTSLINLGDQLAENDLLAAYENYLAGKLEDLDLAQGKIDAALGDLPKA